MRSRILRFPAALLIVALLGPFAWSDEMKFVSVSEDKSGFVLSESHQAFLPWGVNYDHDPDGRLIEDYWDQEWPTVEEDFGEMKDLGANLVRIHLQFGKFMLGPSEPNEDSLKKLQHLIELAQQVGLYLDVTGLGCYHKQDVPAWYDALSERQRWDAQIVFWQAIAETCANSPAIFCYDLMNEPVVSGGMPKQDWLGPAFAGKHFVQYITLDPAGRNRTSVAQQWVQQLTAAIRKHDQRHMITVGLVPWSLDRPGLTSGFDPPRIAEHLDFISVHIYPKAGKLEEARDTLKGFSVGKPVLVEEIFPLNCNTNELEQFMNEADGLVAGWVGFYWGKTIDESRRSRTLPDAMTTQWLEFFKANAASRN